MACYTESESYNEDVALSNDYDENVMNIAAMLEAAYEAYAKR